MSDHSHDSAVFVFADQLVDRLAKRDPLFATEIGVREYDALLPDFSSEQLARDLAELNEDLDNLEALPVGDDVDRVAKELMRERLSVTRTLLESGEVRRTFSVLNSPVSTLRQVFELMPLESAGDADNVRARLSALGEAFATWRRAIEDVVTSGELPARRHVLGVAEQASTYAEGAFLELAQRVATSTGVDVDQAGLRAAATNAEAACGELAAWLRDEVAPRAGEHEACGAERYQRWVGYWTGADLDLEELYAWGYEDLNRIHARMWEIAEELLPGAPSLVAVAEHLDHDPARAIAGTDELLRRLKAFTATTVDALDGTHFDIDPRIRFCDARLAPEGSAAAPYYISPSEDLSRPGTTWYPTLGRNEFAWWSLATTWYHESVPGHHLQIATAMLSSDRQSRYHRLAGSNSGYCEGWALYAERLMNELGYFTDLGDELGFLSCQALRAARIVVDLGLHLELDAPDSLGPLGDLGDCSGRRWTPEMAVALLDEWALQEHAMSVSEVDRYLGLPGQAISYKVGERAFLDARDEARNRLADFFSLKAFHAYALKLGPLGLDTFTQEMAAWDGTP